MNQEQLHNADVKESNMERKKQIASAISNEYAMRKTKEAVRNAHNWVPEAKTMDQWAESQGFQLGRDE